MMIGAISNSYMNYGMYNAGYVSPSAAGVPAGQAGSVGKSAGTSGESVTGAEDAQKTGRTSSPQECQTCKNRKYQDGSNEMNVSFKNASHISPESAASAVRSHEGQHVKNAYAKAEQGNGKVVSATVSIHTAICPECGRTYVAGGETSTQIKYYNEENPYQKDKKSADSLVYSGMNVDASC